MNQAAVPENRSGILKRNWNNLQPYLKPCLYYYIFAIIGTVIYSLGQVGIVAFIKVLAEDEGVRELSKAALWLFSVKLLVVFVFRSAGQAMSTYFFGLVGSLVTHNLRKDMFNHLIKLPSKYYDKNPAGRIVSKLTYNVDQIATGISRHVVVLVRDILATVGLLAWIIYLNWYLALLLIVTGIPIVLFVRYTIKRFQKISKNVQEAYGHTTDDIQRTINNNMSIKVANAQNYAQKGFLKNNKNIFQQQRKNYTVQAISSPVVAIILCLSLIIMINISLSNIPFFSVSFSVVASITTAFFLMYTHIKRLTTFNSLIQACLVASESVFQFLGEPEERKGQQQIAQKIQGTIEFKNVSFRYENTDSNALTDINLKIPAGETVAIVGQSGCGKSTLVSMLPRLYEPTNGRIEIDQMNIHDLDVKDLRNQIAYASQFSMSVHGDIAESICYGTEASLTELQRAAQQACILDFIESLPNGFKTIVSPGTLSNGQIQRIILARTLLKNLPILIFDEITSALDQTTEQLIYQALEHIIQGRTTLIISHRFTMVGLAQRILVMKNGRIVEQGTHQELLAKRNEYYALYTRSAH